MHKNNFIIKEKPMPPFVQALFLQQIQKLVFEQKEIDCPKIKNDELFKK